MELGNTISTNTYLKELLRNAANVTNAKFIVGDDIPMLLGIQWSRLVPLQWSS
jgi:hypothetical protein